MTSDDEYLIFVSFLFSCWDKAFVVVEWSYFHQLYILPDKNVLHSSNTFSWKIQPDCLQRKMTNWLETDKKTLEFLSFHVNFARERKTKQQFIVNYT
jgi:hypothetical protein